VDAAELSNPIGCISNKPQEISAEVGMNVGGIDIGKVAGAQGNSSQVGDGAGTNTIPPRIWSKYFAGRRL
jgi:hypothetical protein